MLKNNILSTNMKTLVNIQKSIQTNIEIASSNSVAINEQTSISTDQSGTVFEINLLHTEFFNIFLPGGSDMSSDKSLYYKFVVGTTLGNGWVLIRLDQQIQVFGNIISPGQDPQDGTINFNYLNSTMDYFIITQNAKSGDYIELFCLTPEKWFLRGVSSYNDGIQIET
jgi:hypothetical protein